jgi:YVTN family beta-propeller protein
MRRLDVLLRYATSVAVLAGLGPGAAHAVSFHSTAIDITPDGNEVWVVNPDHASVSVIRATSPDANTLLAEIPVGREPWCLDIHPTNGEVWVTSKRDDAVFVVDAVSRAVIDTIDAGFGTFGVAFDPSGNTALVTAGGSDEILVVDVATRTVTNTIDSYRRPRGVAWRPDGQRVWVSHLLTSDYTGRLTVVDATDWSTSEIGVQQTFGLDRAGYPSTMQNITLAPAPFDSVLWIPAVLLNSAKGTLSGHLLTPTNTFHAVIRPVNVVTDTDLNWDTYFLSEGGTPNLGFSGGTTPVGGPIAVDFKSSQAFVANMQSNNVTVLNQNIAWPTELAVIPVGSAPIGIVTHPGLNTVYVANWLSRDVTVIRSWEHTVITTVPAVTSEPLPAQILNGKQLFFTSTGNMSLENRNSCSSCHPFNRPDARPWDLTQFGGRHVRASRDPVGSAFTGVLGWTSAFDEIQDNEWSIRDLMGGAGLVVGTPNEALGPPNRGLSRDLDDLSFFIANTVGRPETPFTNPDGSLTAEGDSGKALFHDPLVGCANCHVPPFYTDSSLLVSPYVRHDVGTADPADTNGTGGFDTPALTEVWETGPYLHHHFAKTLEDMLTTFNPNDEHGYTSHLSPEQIGFLATFVKSIGWPESPGPAVVAPTLPASSSVSSVFPNPFRTETSLRFRVDGPPAEVRVEVFDVTGRRVRTLLERRLTQGAHIVGWDTTDEGGRPVAPGTYFARLLLDGRKAEVRKMTVVR